MTAMTIDPPVGGENTSCLRYIDIARQIMMSGELSNHHDWSGGGSTRTVASLEQGVATHNQRRSLAR